MNKRPLSVEPVITPRSHIAERLIDILARAAEAAEEFQAKYIPSCLAFLWEDEPAIRLVEDDSE